MQSVMNAVKFGSYYAIECTRQLLSDVDTATSLAGLTNLVARTLKDAGIKQNCDGLIGVTGMVKEWTTATKLPGRLHDLTSGKAVSRPFFGNVNYVKVLSRLCLIGTDYFNSVGAFTKWGAISKEAGSLLTFYLQQKKQENISFVLGIGGWGADLIDAASRIYEEGPSIEAGLTSIQDLAKLASICVGRCPAALPKLAQVGLEASVLLLGILKAMVKAYEITVPAWMYATNSNEAPTPM